MRPDQTERNQRLRSLYENSNDRAILWIDDGTGQIADELVIESRIRTGSGGCELCHEPLDGSERRGRIDFDDRGLPRLLWGSGDPVCEACVEWIRCLHHYAETGPLSEPRFRERDLVLRTTADELYEVLGASITGIPAAGVWFPIYRCRRIEVRQPRGEVLPVALGLEFELADFELQPVPPRYGIEAPRSQVTRRPPPIDLVGAPSDASPVRIAPRKSRAPMMGAERRLLLPGKSGGT
jgi:hypothetical protein